MKKFLFFTVIFLQLIAKAQPTVNGLVAHFKFDGNLTNAGSASVTASSSNTTFASNYTGTANKAIQFAGSSSSYSTITDNGNLDFNGDFSIAFGVYITNTAASQGFYDNGLNYAGCGIWYFSSDNTLRFNFKNGSIGASGALPVNQWKAVCAVRSGSTLLLYVNGVLATSGTEGASTITYPYPPLLGQMYFAAGGGNYNPASNGSKMDELRFYNRALSSSEILALSNDIFNPSNPVTLSCPGNNSVQLLAGQCNAVVNTIDPVLTPSGSSETVTYTLTGATTANGSGTASGQTFNTGITTVAYALASDPTKTCSFTVTVIPAAPSISISIGSSTICSNDLATFTANTTNGGNNPYYIWKKNGIVFESGSSNISQIVNLQSGDIISCDLTSNAACASPQTVSSNGITVTVNPATNYYRDADGDGYGNPSVSILACSLPSGYVTNNTDCNDNDATKHASFFFYIDSDGDGYGTGSAQYLCAVSAAAPPAGYSTNGFDCNDADASKHGSFYFYLDADGDGYGTGNTVSLCAVNAGTAPAGYSINNTDCNDANATVHTGITYYKDNDGDGFGDANNTTTVCSLTPPSGYVTNSTDCDDTKALYADTDGDGYGADSPVACGVADNTDCNDADATVHTGITYYKDNDGDGFGDANNTTTVCSSAPPAGYVTNSADCDDTKALYADTDGDGYGAGIKTACGVANNTDCNDADATVHTGITYYKDNDGDGFGDAGNPTTVCSSSAPAGYVTNNTDCDDTKALYADVDGDGYGAGAKTACGVASNTDCNDDDASVHTGITYYKDNDGDGFGDANNTTTVCSSTPPSGYVSNNTDCDDTKALYADADGDGYGAGPKVACGVASNTDCNDADASVHTGITYYKDNDGDGFGDANNPTTVCSSTPPSGYVTNSTDCDDSKALYADEDGDGFGAGPKTACGVASNIDCNDADASVHTGITYYKDNDGDGFGDANNPTTVCSSTPPSGYVTNSTDCDDSKALYADTDGDGYGAGPKVACGVADNTDCNDDDATVHTGITYYKDNDGDGFGDANNSTTVCSSTAPAGYVNNSTDCDDTKALYKDADGDGFGAGAKVACGVADNTDCNDADVGVHTGMTYYKDNDGDGFGDINTITMVCSGTAPTGYISNNTDCNDADATVYPGASEICDGKDNNCNGTIDEGVKTTFYRDADGDGYGNAAVTTQTCSVPTGYVSNSTDCNDADATVYPGAVEICDGKDNNCNGTIDEGVKTTFYRDADGDGYGNAAVTTQACSVPAGYVSNSTDCNDNSSTVHPGAVEICGNNIDDNCNGQVDEGCTTTTLPKIYINNTSVTEGNSGTKNASFLLYLSKLSNVPVTVQYQTADNTAKAPGDYVQKTGTVTFPANTYFQTITVQVKGETLNEANEIFMLQLSNAVKGTIGNSSAYCVIYNDDAVPAITINDASATESSLQALVKVTLNAASGQVITVKYDTKDGTAKASGDYTAVSNGTVTFQPGEITKNISVVIKQDALNESTEKFGVVLKQPVNACISKGTAQISILNSQTVTTSLLSKSAVADPVTVAPAQMKVSPNPASQQLNVQVVGKTNYGKVELELMDQSGRAVKRWTKNYDFNGQVFNLQVADIVSGIYFVIIKDNKSSWLQHKVLIQH